MLEKTQVLLPKRMEDQAICRVCRMGPSSNHPLFHPCKCCGSIKYVHQDCLLEWLSHSKKKYCEVCDYAFIFTPVYRKDMPSRIPTHILFQNGIRQLLTVCIYLLRSTLAFFVWLVLLPTLTLWAWRFYVWGTTNFGKSILETRLPLDLSARIFQYFTMKRFFDDCLYGLTMTTAVIIFAVTIYLFKEWVIQNTATLENRETEGIHHRRPSRGSRTILQDQEQLRIRLEQLSRELESRSRTQPRRPSFTLPSVSDDFFTVMSAPNGAQSPFAAWRDYQQQTTGTSMSQTRTWRAREFNATTQISERGDYFGELAVRQQEERREPTVEEEEEEEEEEENQTFDLVENRDKILEAVGIYGNPLNLIKNPLMMSIMTNLCLGITIWVPYIIGKTVLLGFPSGILKKIAHQLADTVYQMPISVAQIIQPMFDYLQPIAYHIYSSSRQYASDHEKVGIALYVSAGYLVLIFIGSWYLYHNRTLVSRATLQQQTVLKVLLFILFELILFPTLCGLFLDLSTLPFFEECDLVDRIHFLQNNPYSGIFLHWFAGTGFIYQFSVVISHVREVVRPGVMWFIRDPNDPQFHPLQEIISQPILSLLKQFMSNVATYFMLIMVGMGLVSLLVCKYTAIYPIIWTFNVPLSILPLDLLAVQFVLPHVMEHIVPREFSKKAVMTWWHIVARALYLSSFMFGQVESENDRKGGYLAQVPAYDHIPYVGRRNMIVPVDPQTLIPLNETDRLLGHPAGSGMGQTTIVHIPSLFKLRVVLFLLLIWFTGSILVCSMSFVPLLFGRHLLVQLLKFQIVHDVYAFAVGACMMIALSSLLNTALQKYTILYQQHGKIDTNAVKHYLSRKVYKIFRYGYLFFMVGIIIPFLIGCMLDLYVFIPIKLSISHVEKIDLYILQDWSIGVASTSLLCGLIGILPIHIFRNTWIETDWYEMDLSKATRRIFAPLIFALLYINTIPSLFTFGAIYALGKY
ncbi:unnamed protein product [Rhizopus stolonifer]